ncbi:PKD domain-containing protein [bacterium]|nr:PKD domain-containing protein [bacterium]
MISSRSISAFLLSCASLAPAAPWIPDAAAIAARTNGVAPLAVFFDASATTSEVTALPFHELDYAWDFGDPCAGAWETDGRSRNYEKGPVAAHVFVSAGTYNVQLTVRDMAGGVASRTIPIVVMDTDAAFPGTNTVCISASGDSTGAPAGALQVTSASFTAAQPYIRQGARILFRRGETWVATAGLSIVALGPGMIGSFGAGAPPRIVATNNLTFFSFSNRVPKCDDWRVADFELDGAQFAGSSACGAGGTASRLLLLRVAAYDVHGGFSFPNSILDYNNANGYPGHTLYDQIALAGCSVRHLVGGSGGNGGYIAAQRFSLQGCEMHDSTGAEHVLRMPWIMNGVIAHNNMSRQSPVKHLIKLHAPGYTNAGLGYLQYTERVIISDNRFVGNGAWSVTPGPQNSSGDERARDLLIERNHFVHSTNVQVSLVIWARQVTVRNNIFDVTDGASRTAISVSRRGIEPASTDVRIYNNTAYTGTGNVTLVSIAAVTTNTTVINNFVAAPAGGATTINSGTGVNLAASHNLGTASPGFAGAPPVAPEDFTLLPVSPAVNAGTDAAVFDDYFLNGRPFNATNDLGACELVPEPFMPALAAALAAVLTRGVRRGRQGMAARGSRHAHPAVLPASRGCAA